MSEEPIRDHREPPRTLDEMWRRLWGDPRIPWDKGAMGEIQDSIRRMERMLTTIGIMLGTGLVTVVVDIVVSHTH